MIIQSQDREQTVMFSSLEDLISPEHTVRIIDYLIDSILKKHPERYKYKGESSTGRPAYSVSMMLKLYIYGCLNRINSSRRLEIESTRNIELIWLLGNLSPDFKTISDFRRDNKEIIKQCSKDVKGFLKFNGLVNCNYVSIDGTKLKANANREMLSKDRIVALLFKMDSEISNYMIELDSLDAQESVETSSMMEMRASYEKNISRMQDEINVLKSALNKLESDKKNYISLTDFDCSKQKSRDGVIPGYNVQMACDIKHGFIVAEDVSIESNDINQLKPMIEEIESELGMIPENALLDTGYCKLDDIQAIEAKGVNCFVTHQKEQINNPEITFIYQKETDSYICSQGQYLKLRHKNKQSKNSIINVYVGENCQSCTLFKKCTKSKKGRHISRYWNQDFRDKHREKMSTKLAKQMSKIRKSTIEPIFGIIKVWLGKIPLQTRGKTNVKTEIKIITISYNIKRLISLFSFKEVMSMIDGYLSLDFQKTLNLAIILSFKVHFFQK
jgi:transposase